MTAIRVELLLADGSFTTGMLRAGQSMAQFNAQLIKANPALANIAKSGGNVVSSMQRAEMATKGFLGTARDLSIVIGMVSMGISKISGVSNTWVGDIVRINSEMERLRFQMQGMSRAADPISDAAANVNYLRESAMKMPFSLKTITNGFVKLKSTGTDPLNGSLKAISDGVAAFGGNDEAFSRIVLGISQMSGKGVIQMEEMRQQLAESMPRAMELMARSMGVSMGDLIQAISTGTVAAKPALASFYGEIERTFGGSAEYMMNTFSGQISKMYTSWQMLATGAGGESFFNEVKSQLLDLNDFLASGVAKTLAQDVGSGLNSIINAFRGALGFVVEYRNEIGRLAVVLAAGFGTVRAAAAITALTAAVQRNILSMTMLRTNMASAFADISLGVSGFRSMGTAVIGSQVALMGLRQALVGILAGMSALAPWVAAIGLAVYGAGEYFGWFSNKVKDAYDSLQKYGAESAKQARQIVEDRRQQLKAEQDMLVRQQAFMEHWSKSNFYGSAEMPMANFGDVDAKLAANKKNLEDLQKNSDDFIREAAEREDSKVLRNLNRSIDDKIKALNNGYDRQMLDLNAAFMAEREKLIENGESTKAINAKYARDTLEARKKHAKEKIKVVDDELAETARKLALATSEDQKRQFEAYTNGLWTRKKDQQQEIKRAQDEDIGIKTLDKDTNSEKAIERARRTVSSLSDDVTNLKAKLEGASGAYAEMQARIARGDFGKIADGGEAVKQLHEDLLRLSQDKELFDKLLGGQQKAERDIARTRIKLLERELELKEKLSGRKMTDGERIQFKMDNGYYEGLGPIENIKKALEGVSNTFVSQEAVSAKVATTLRENTFGENTVRRIETVNDALVRMSTNLANISRGASGVSFANLGQDLGASINNGIAPVVQNLPAQMSERMKLAMDRLMSKGWSREVSAGIVGNMVVESGMDSRAVGDSGAAVGLAQWRDERRVALRQFLAAQGKSEDDFYGQVDFVDYELRNKEKSAASIANLSATAQAAAIAIMEKYERPAAWAQAQTSGRRQGAAQQAYAMADGNNQPVPVPASVPAPTIASFALAPLPTPDIDAALRYNAALQDRQQKTAEITAETIKLSDQEKKNQLLEQQSARKEYLEDLIAQTKNAGENFDELGKNYARLVKGISSGKLGSNTDINADEYKALVDAAKELDRVQKETALTRKAQGDSEREIKELEKERLSLNQQIADQMKLTANPDHIPDSEAYRRLNLQLEEYLKNVARVHGGTDNDAYRQALQVRTTMLQSQLQLEGATQTAAAARRTREINESLMTESQQRKLAHERELAEIDARSEKLRAAGMEEVWITEQAEKDKAAIRKKYAAETNPVTRQMQQWGDLTTNLQNATTGWMDSLSSGVADLIMGTNNLRSIANAILKDMLNMGIKYLASGIKGQMNGGGQAKGAAGGGAAKGGAAKAAASTVGVMHTGGIIGVAGGTSRLVSDAAFINAPKFHTGGIVGRLGANEVPIIAEKGEGIFTAEQMGAMGGFAQSNTFQISAPVTVNGSSGTPEQNDDLAKRMARQMEVTMRGVVADELRKQTRPGNMMNSRSR